MSRITATLLTLTTTISAHELIFAVHQNNLDQIDTILNQVSDPDHSKYGQHLSFDEVGELTRDNVALSNVHAWLKKTLPASISNTCIETPHGDFITCQGEVKDWEIYLATDLSHENHKVSIAPPKPLQKDVLGIHHGTTFNDEDAKQRMTTSKHYVRTTKPEAAGYCTPELLRKTYNITSKGGDGLGSQSVFETAQHGDSADLLKFQKTYNVEQHTIAKQIGDFWDDGTCAISSFSYECGEANLDIQYMMAIGNDVPTWFWGTDKTTTFANWITQVSSAKDGPLVHSVSYGQLEEETDAQSKDTFSTTVKKLGVQGISVLVSSGDDGVANSKARMSSGLCGYTPQWPAVCPWVTTVGATQGPEEFKPEVSCASSNNNTYITSGGGFATTFATPSYQETVVNTFLNLKNTSLGNGYNTKGRGYPDVALIGHLYPIVNSGEVQYKDGTSASTPVMAGILSLVNAERLKLKKSSVGFANPALYKWAGNQNIFNDITSGKNNCCAGGWSGSTVVCCPENGFYAVKGWDPVTGLGSINVGNLIAAWSALP